MLAPPSRLLAGDLTAVLLRLGDFSNKTAASSICCHRPFLQPAPLLIHPPCYVFFCFCFFSLPPKLPKLQLLAFPVTLPKHFQREATKLHQRWMFTSFMITCCCRCSSSLELRVVHCTGYLPTVPSVVSLGEEKARLH